MKGGTPMLMRNLAVAFAATAASVAAGLAAGPLADGTYKGKGAWEGADGAKGTYRVDATIRGDSLAFRWQFDAGGPQEQVLAFRFVPAAGGGYSLVDAKNAAVGSARCLGGECLLEMGEAPIRVVQTVRVKDGRLETFGTKTGPQFGITYAESLLAD
jgi:hypothetical protein